MRCDMQFLWVVRLTIPVLFGIYGQHVHEPRLTVFEKPMTWREAEETCKQNNGVIAEESKALKKLLEKSPKRPYWIGKSLTPWVMLQGCIEWKYPTNKTAIYKMSKYNQMLECASACRGSVSFLLQKNSCYCLDKEDNLNISYVPYYKCSDPCPGMTRDKCGGRNVFTHYTYYRDEISRGDKMYNCVCIKHQTSKECNCNSTLGFTCEKTNGLKVSYKKGVPDHDKSLSYSDAVQFCRNLPDGLRMSPIPKLHEPVFDKEYWTTISRSVDWNYDTVSQRRPDYGCVAMVGDGNSYREEFTEASTKNRFVCQYDDDGHEINIRSNVGDITSPGYPQQYAHNQLYKWNIEFNDVRTVQLAFENIHLEDSTDCVYDYILVMQNNRSLEKLCGSYKNKQIVTRAKPVTIVFRSDRNVEETGFKLSWLPMKVGMTPYPEEDVTSSKEESVISGGTIVGITVIAAVLFVAVASFTACLIYKKTHKAQPASTLEESTNVHNETYATPYFHAGNGMIGSSVTGSGIAGEMSYLTVINTNDNETLRKEVLHGKESNRTQFSKVNADDNYLNAGLPSDIKAPYYDQINSSQYDHHYMSIDKTKKDIEMVNEDGYTEIADIKNSKKYKRKLIQEEN